MTGDSKRQRVVELLAQKIGEMADPAVRTRDDPGFTRWHDEVQAVLSNFFGPSSVQVRKFHVAAYPMYSVSAFDSAANKARQRQAAHEKALPQMKAVLEAILWELENLTDIAGPSRYQLTSPIYWGEWLWCATHFSTAVRWVKMHRLVSAIITLVMFVGAILAIWGFVLNW